MFIPPLGRSIRRQRLPFSRPCWPLSGEGIEIFVQRQKRTALEWQDYRYLGFGQNRRSKFFRPSIHVLDRQTRPPLRDRLGVDAPFAAQRCERSFRSLYCCSGGVRWSWRSCDKLVPCGFPPFRRMDHTIKPWEQTLGLRRAGMGPPVLRGLSRARSFP